MNHATLPTQFNEQETSRMPNLKSLGKFRISARSEIVREYHKEYMARNGYKDVQEIQCGFDDSKRIGKQYYITGFFGWSQGYGSWDSALKDIARRHGFKYEEINK